MYEVIVSGIVSGGVEASDLIDTNGWRDREEKTAEERREGEGLENVVAWRGNESKVG